MVSISPFLDDLVMEEIEETAIYTFPYHPKECSAMLTRVILV